MSLIFRQLFDLESSTYTYLLADPESKEGVIIDPVKEHLERDVQLIKDLDIKLKYVLETHLHADHITSSALIREATGAKICIGDSEVKCADITISDGMEIEFGKYTIKILATPGHTSGCRCYYVDGMVFTGDTLLIRGCGRTDFQGGSAETLYKNINEKLFTLPDQTLVYPAHNYKSLAASTIGEEKQLNPRLASKSKEEFIEIMNNLNLQYPKKMDVAVPANRQCGK